MVNFSGIRVDAASDRPLYRQLADEIARWVDRGALLPGDRLPATRELAGLLRVNRTTVSAAYALLEQTGMIEGQVGRGSFVARKHPDVSADFAVPADSAGEISFASSRPASRDFPLDSFRRLAKEVIDSPAASDILQLGDARGFSPLRRHLLQEAQAHGIAGPGDDLLITNGCQQALDLVARVFAGRGRGVAVEDPVYHGMLRAFSRTGADVFGVPLDQDGIDTAALEQVVQRHQPSLVVLTPSFQNPSGVTLSLDRRRHVARLAEQREFLLVEIDIYSALRYRGAALPPVKSLGSAQSLLLGSYSKIAFPGLRVGWCIGPRSAIARLAEAKEISDLHSDQLSQAVLLKFAQSGELSAHLERTLRSGMDRLSAALRACEAYLPRGSHWTKPDGGMNIWVELPAPLTADALLDDVRRHGVRFLPGRHFSAREPHVRGFRLSYGGLTPPEIRQGIRIIGEAAAAQLVAMETRSGEEAAPALV